MLVGTIHLRREINDAGSGGEVVGMIFFVGEG